MEFTAEYGHVQIMTSEERSTMHLGSWAIGIGHIARELKKQELPKVSDRCLHWLQLSRGESLVHLLCASSWL